MPGVMLKCARVMLGISRQDVLRAAKASGLELSMARYNAIEADTDGSNIGAVEWWTLCECVGLSCDTFGLGYSARWHLMRVRRQIETGEFRLPVMPSLKVRIAALAAWEEADHERWMVRPGLRFALKSQTSSTKLLHRD